MKIFDLDWKIGVGLVINALATFFLAAMAVTPQADSALKVFTLINLWGIGLLMIGRGTLVEVQELRDYYKEIWK